MTHWKIGTLVQRHTRAMGVGTMVYFSNWSLKQWQVEQWDAGTMGCWYNDIVEQWYIGKMTKKRVVMAYVNRETMAYMYSRETLTNMNCCMKQ